MISQEAERLLNERFGKDSLIALATAADGIPHVRTVNACYREGAFYGITNALSGKMQQIAGNPQVAISGDWFTAHGRGENLGWIGKPENASTAQWLREAFSAWYGNGHTNEADPNTCILCIRLTDGILFSHGTRYDLSFA